jgi:hypothetical protein
MKTCTKCKIERDISLFAKRTGSSDGHGSWCKICCRLKNNSDTYKKHRQEYALSEQGKQVDAVYRKSEKYKKLRDDYNHSDKRKAAKTKYLNSEKGKATTKNCSLRILYGITLEDYEIMYASQKGKCKICDTFFEVLHIDHNHTTNKVRGLLCNNCNNGIGRFFDSSILTERATEYLKAH